jgi:hypothetical protein
LLDPAPLLLNTDQLPWETFESLVMQMVRVLDGAIEVRKYGVPGQAQHGLDLVAFFATRPPTIYQVKRVATFDGADLANAVAKYAAGPRPFDAARMVIAIACEARETSVIEALATVRRRQPTVAIELWDRQAISDRLRDQPKLVTTFFGLGTATVFCSVAPTGDAPPASVAADAIVRGPLAHLQLLDLYRSALATIDSDPASAATSLGDIARRLDRSGFSPHAGAIREQHAAALTASGQREAAARARIELGWDQLRAGDTFTAGTQAREVLQWKEAPDSVAKSARLLGASAAYRREYGVDLEDVATEFDQSSEDDAHRIDAALLLVEESVAARRPELVNSRAPAIKALADRIPHDRGGELSAARIETALADCLDDWDPLVSSARQTYRPEVAALVVARFARSLALKQRPEAAIATWRDAIERACIEGLNDDAADWLYALRAVRTLAGDIQPDINEPHRHAQALRAAGTGTVLPEPFNARERALAHIAERKWPDALEALKRYLWRSVIGADWSGELDAHKLVGNVYIQTGRVSEAIRSLVIAGEQKRLEEFARALPDGPTPVGVQLLSDRPWERVAAYAFVAARADLLPDADAQAWEQEAIAEIFQQPDWRPFAPSPWLAGFRAFGELADLTSEDEAREFIAFGATLIPREAKTFRHTDEAHVKALIRIAHRHPALREAATSQLIDALITDQQMADRVLSSASNLLAEYSDRTVAMVLGAAEQGSAHAALALVAAGSRAAPAKHLARERLESAIAPRERKDGVVTVGTWWPQTAVLAQILPISDRQRLARGMLRLAADDAESPPNRSDALIAAGIAARRLPRTIRHELFEQAMRFALGEIEPPASPFFPGDDDPLQRFRFSLGESTLVPSGLVTAGALATSATEARRVVQATVPLLRDADESMAYSIGMALTSLVPLPVDLPLDLLGVHQSHWLRAAAAFLWAQEPLKRPELGLRLARDLSAQVRATLASRLQQIPGDPAGIKALLALDPRRSVRRTIAGQMVLD